MNARFTNSLVKSSLLVSAIAVSLVGCGGSAASTNGVATKLAASYTVETVEAPAGGGLMSFQYMSPNGNIGGTYNKGGKNICFSYKNGTITEQTPSDRFTSIQGVNDDGSVEGGVTANQAKVPFSSSGTGFHEIIPPVKFISGDNAGRDSTGNGYASFYDGTNGYSFRETGGTFTPLTVEGSTFVSLAAVTPKGLAAGFAKVGGKFEYYTFAPNATTGVKAMDSADMDTVMTINDQGTIGGYKEVGGNLNAAIYLNGQVQLLPSLGGDSSIVRGLNDGNIAVGDSRLPTNGVRHAFGWTAIDGTVDLNSRVSKVGFTASSAMAIDSKGVIIGEGVLNGTPVGFIMTPVKL